MSSRRRRSARVRRRSGRASADRGSAEVGHYVTGAAIVAVATLVAIGLHHLFSVTNVALVFLTAILIDAVLFGLGPSLFACLLAALAYNFFFLPPLYTFTIADPENVVALFFFGIVAVIASNLAARVRGQALAAQQRARTTEDLYQFSRKLTVAVTLDDLLWATAHQIALMLRVRVVLLLPGGRTASPCGPAIRPRTCWMRPTSRRRSGAGRRTTSPAATPTRCPAPNGCSSRCAPAVGRWASSASSATSPARC